MFASVVPGYSSAKHRKNRGSLPTFLWQAGQKDSLSPRVSQRRFDGSLVILAVNCKMSLRQVVA